MTSAYFSTVRKLAQLIPFRPGLLARQTTKLHDRLTNGPVTTTVKAPTTHGLYQAL